ncbi:MAG: rhodanese-like domain-containing protein [Caldilineaceae bacterium]
MDIAEKGYAHPEALVSTEWVADHLDDPNVRIVESDEDILLYETGHIPGAVKIDWQADLNDPLVRDYIEREQFEALMAKNGISNETTVVFYGDKNNWWACYAFGSSSFSATPTPRSWTAGGPSGWPTAAP